MIKKLLLLTLFLLPNFALAQFPALTAPQGGTGHKSYTIGDILYASATNVLSKLGIGGEGTCLRVSSGLPAWLACPAGSGGAGTFSTTTTASGELQYPTNASLTSLNSSALTSKWLYNPFTNNMWINASTTVGGQLTTSYITSTSTTVSNFNGGVQINGNTNTYSIVDGSGNGWTMGVNTGVAARVWTLSGAGGGSQNFLNASANTGTLGIGTSSPGTTLGVNGAGAFTGEVRATHFYATSTTATTTLLGGLWAGSELTVIPSGFVGINTTQPSTQLNVVSPNTSDNTLNTKWNYANSADNYHLALGQHVTSGRVQWVFDQRNNNTDYRDALVFDLGNIGIGTTTPDAKISIFGDAKVAGIQTASSFVSTSTTATSTFAAPISATRGTFGTFSVTGLASCDTIDTDATGNFRCGTDAEGVGGSGTNYFTSSGANTILNTGSNVQAPTFEATSTTATSTITNALQIGGTAGSNALKVTAGQNYPASDSIGGLINVTNTNNSGSALTIYSNAGAVRTNDLLRIKVDNVAADQRGLSISNDGTRSAAIFDCTNATRLSGGECVNITDVAGANRTTLGVSGAPIGLGLLKFTLNSGADANASGLSMQIDDTDPQGFFVDTVAGYTGKFFNLRNGGRELFTLTSDGNLGLGTSSPYAKLSVVGEVVGSNFTATSTTATSSMPKLLSSFFQLGTDVINDFTGTGLTIEGGVLNTTLGTSIAPTELANTDFGDFTCNGTTCALDNDTVAEAELDLTAVTLADFTNDAGFITSAASTTFRTDPYSPQGLFSFLNTGTTTFAGGIQGTYLNLTGANTATSTSANGFNLTGGCFSINSVCITGGGGVGDGTASSTLFADDNNYTGVNKFSNANTALYVTSASFPAATIERTTTDVDSSLGSLGLLTTTSGNMIDGFGSSFSYFIKDNAGVDNPIVSISGVRSGADNSGEFQIRPYLAGTVQTGLYVFKPNGNFGIGTSTPGTKLGVVGPIVATGQITGTNFYATSTTATSTFLGGVQTTRLQVTSGTSTAANGFNLTGGCFSINGTCIGGGVGGSSQWTTNSNDIYYNTGNVGIGTTTPYAKLSVTGEVVANNFTATSTTATSTFRGDVVISKPGTGTTTTYMYSKTSTFGARIILEDVDGAGCTEVTALNGVLAAKTVTCPTEI